MVVDVTITNGLRLVSFDIDGINGNLPQQAITSSNLNHVKAAGDPHFDFKTDILEIVEFKPKDLVNDSDYRERRKKIVSETIKENPNKLCLFTIRGARRSLLRLTEKANETLINFQIDCGFKLIKVFIKYVKNAVKVSRYYRSLIPKGRTFVAQLDENMSHATFRALYLECYRKHKDKIICFFGRKPTKKSKKIHNKLNFLFISARKKDRIIRLISFTPKSIGGVVSSLVYNFFGFDVYSFLTIRWNQNIPIFELKALEGFTFVPLTKDTSLVCPLTGKNLYIASKEFEKELEKSSLPVSVHDIVRLNEKLKVLHKTHTREKLKEFLKDRVF